MQETKAARKTGWAIATGVLSALAFATVTIGNSSLAQEAYTPQFTPDGQLIQPDGKVWRDWPYIGAIATPNGLNDGEAPFPEFHSVYIDPESWKHWRETGTFREGTVLAKELNRVYSQDAHPDGSTEQSSGRGFFMGEFSGFEIALKSKARYADEPGYWAYFSFGHHAPPYSETAKKLPAEACNACHEVAAEDDFVFTQFYPVLSAAKGKN